jgi:hypothetical protein
LTRRHVAPTVADQKALPEINPKLSRSLKEHPRFGFTAAAPVPVQVITNFHQIDGEHAAQIPIYRLDHLASLLSGGNVRLVGHNDRQEPGGLETPERIFDAGKYLDVGH